MKGCVWCAAGLLLAGGCVSRPANDVKVPTPDLVVFIGLDGLTARSVTRVNAPTFGRLMREGAWTLSSRSILPSASACNWRSVFACAASEQHGYNNWNSRAPVFPASATNERGLFPDVFSELARQRPTVESTFVYEWPGMAFTVDTNAVTRVCRSAGFDATKRTVAEFLDTKQTGFLAVVVDSPDGVGHKSGWDSPAYDQRVLELDAWIGDVIRSIERAGLADRTVLVVTSDHGGEGKGHGRSTLADMERPVFIWGANVRKGHRLSYGGAVYDTGATLAALLDLDFPQAWIGRPHAEAFRKR